MIKHKRQQNLNSTKINFRSIQRLFIVFGVSIFLCGSILLFNQSKIVSSQNKSDFKIGERITYNISFEKFENAAYAEIYVVSKGKLQDKEAIELSAKLKSVDLVSAAFYYFDEIRTTFVSNETGLPFYVRNISNGNGLPKERIDNFLKAPTTNYDLLSLIYKVRQSGGAGSFSVKEGESIYNFDFSATGGEVLKTDAGEFDTTISTVQSTYLTDLEITEFQINFTNDERSIPVQVRFKTPKGRFKATIASVQNLEPTETPEITPTVTPTIPITLTPTPTPTPIPYIKNQSLSNDLPFDLGETLRYKVTTLGRDVGTVTLQAKERNEIEEEDTLILTAKVTALGQGNPVFVLNDGIEARVDPFTLAPMQIDLKFTNALSIFNTSTEFDQSQGIATIGNKRIDVPVGTHSILSLAYAIRSFNLKPSLLDPTNPVNDTRVAVMLGDKAYVLTLRPTKAQIIEHQGKKISAQLINIRVGNPTIDSLNLSLWLSNDVNRLPLRFTAGNYQAELIDSKIIPPQ